VPWRLAGPPLDDRAGNRRLDRQHLFAPGERGVPGVGRVRDDKAALAGLTRNIAADYGVAGIRANAVAPGAIWTPWNEDEIGRAPDPAAAEAQFEGYATLGAGRAAGA
jgi:NAD(P)-dependent dehydrogenase (short-subunit alcohol dehydrogenase family)